MFDDFKELLSFFNAHNVKDLVVGGYAVSFHAQPRAGIRSKGEAESLERPSF